MAKILHVITRMDRGGSAQNTMENCLGLLDKYEVVLVCGNSLESGMTREETAIVEGEFQAGEEKGMKVIRVAALRRRISPVHDLIALCAIWRIIWQQKPDIVHTHTSKAGILGRLAAWFSRVPVIIHTSHGHVFYGHFSAAASQFFLLLEKVFARVTQRMVALTEGEKQDYIRYQLCPEEKIVTIHSGVPVDKFLQAEVDIARQKQTLGIDPKRFVVGTVGWLSPIKGPQHLLQAMHIVWQSSPECELVYVGKGELEEDLKRAVQDSGAADKVRFLGWRDDVHTILPVFDLFVLASLNEGMGRVLVEAMAAGKPLVASKVGGVSDLVVPGRTGYLVPPADEKALAEAILLIRNDPRRAHEMGEAGRRLCRNYSVAAMLQKLVALYEETLRA